VPGGNKSTQDVYTITLDPKSDLEGLRVIHSVTAAVRAVTTPDALDATRRNISHEHPLVWKRQSGRRTMLIGYTADSVVGMSQAEGRALLARLLEWTAQPAFTYRHHWQVGDLVIWDNTGALHRVVRTQ
jgi:alpha-ketoglutarate-dependent taurine dioxygenase